MSMVLTPVQKKILESTGDMPYSIKRINKIGLKYASAEDNLKDGSFALTQNRIQVSQLAPDGGGFLTSIPVLESDKVNGEDLLINFWDINQVRIQDFKARSKKSRTPEAQKIVTYQKRRIANPVGDMKYKNPAGFAARPYYPKGLCRKYAAEEKITTLILTEGEIKSIVMDLHGIPVVGIPGISNYKEKETGELYWGITSLIKTCAIDNVIVLYDGDATDLSKNALEKGQDLHKRPASFANSAKGLREVLKPLKVDVYWCCNRKNSIDATTSFKALDDMMLERPDLIDLFKQELLNPNSKAKLNHFDKFNITGSLNPIYKHFGTRSIDVFYSKHEGIIGEKEFVFRGTVYKFNDEDQKVQVVTPEAAKNYMRIGDDYYEEYEGMRPNGEMYRKMERRLKSTITDDHTTAFLKHIPKYKGYCNVPIYQDYSKVLNQEYNMQYQLPSEPSNNKIEAHEIPNSISFVKHIFGTDETEWRGTKVPRYELGLDYLSLLIWNRAINDRIHIQKLPVLVLVSKENHTGKSLFAEKWMRALLGKNAVLISNEDIQSEFNAPYAYARLITIEEAMLDKKAVSEKIKYLSTADSIMVNDKNAKKHVADFVGCFIINSNNEKRAVYVTEDDIRYWVLKAPVPKKLDQQLKTKLEKEVPDFLSYLLNRPLFLNSIMKSEDITRMYFPAKVLETDALDVLRETSKPKMALQIEVAIREMFLDFDDEVEIKMSLGDIAKQLLGGSKDTPFIKECLKDYIKCTPFNEKKVKRYKYPYWKENFHDEDAPAQASFKTRVGRPYTFLRSDFFETTTTDTVSEQEDVPF